MQAQFQFILRAAFVTAAAIFAAGCTSPPAKFYTLDAVAVEPATGSLADSRILVGPVELPAYLDRPQMVIRDSQGQLTYQEFHRWAEPLDAAFLRTLTADLGIAAASQQVVAVPISQRRWADFRVLARVSRFDVDRNGRAVLELQWYAEDAKGNIIVTPRKASFSRTAPVPLEPAASAAALSGTIADFAADVARNLAAVKIPAS